MEGKGAEETKPVFKLAESDNVNAQLCAGYLQINFSLTFLVNTDVKHVSWASVITNQLFLQEAWNTQFWQQWLRWYFTEEPPVNGKRAGNQFWLMGLHSVI